MKLNRVIVYLIVFSAFFTLGFTQGNKSRWLAAFLPGHSGGAAAGTQVEKQEQPHTPQPLPPNESKTPVPTNTKPAPTQAAVALEGQLNLLIIGVNHLQAERPLLEGVWMALTIPGSPRLTLMPVYPSPEARNSDTTTSLAQHFGIDEDGQPSADFLASLKTSGLWWSGYLMVDQIALIELVEFVNDLDIEADAPINGVLAVTGLPDPEEDSFGALEGQTILAAELCRRTARLSPSIDMAPLLALFPEHARTDLNAVDLATAWKTMRETNRGLACEFPAQLINP